MTALFVVLMFVGFAAVDALVRAVSRRMADARARREREAVLATSLRLDFTEEAPSLKRVQVQHPLARILAVDDEPIVLDSFRKILVLAGYDVDTVESGPEALGLVQRRDYDFVFTDLKMPGMDGVEVVQAVHHLRPDVDVAVITGYGTIETVVETMQHGAVSYVQKPFTEDELLEFTRTLLVKRQARLEAQRRPTVRLVAPEVADTVARNEYCLPGGAFVSSGHTWGRVEPDGTARVGIDDFARKALGAIEKVELPQRGLVVRRGEPLFSVRRGDRVARFAAPLSGRVVEVNDGLARHASAVADSPYDRGWICLLTPADLAKDLRDLRIGKPAAEWLQEEIVRWRGAEGPAEDGNWVLFEERFLAPEPAVAALR
jgi:CheY-like chemotaxis protein